jgi:hypothetical protein
LETSQAPIVFNPSLVRSAIVTMRRPATPSAVIMRRLRDALETMSLISASRAHGAHFEHQFGMFCPEREKAAALM